MNITIRSAIAADTPACADIHIRSWIFAYTGIIPDEIISAQNGKRPVKWQKMLSGENSSHFVAVLEDKVIGIITLDPPRDTDLPSGTYELTGLYLDPCYIGHGYGRQVMDWVKEKVKAMGYESISLWVLEGNVRARRFYERCGFFADGRRKKQWSCRYNGGAIHNRKIIYKHCLLRSRLLSLFRKRKMSWLSILWVRHSRLVQEL